MPRKQRRRDKERKKSINPMAATASQKSGANAVRSTAGQGLAIGQLERQTNGNAAAIPPTEKLNDKSWLKRVGAIVLAVLSFLGLSVSGIYSFVEPKLDISPSELKNNANPLSGQFTVKNEGNLPVYDVQPVCKILTASIGNVTIRNQTSWNNGDDDGLIDQLNRNERRSVNCESALTTETPFSAITLEIQVGYSPMLWRRVIKTATFSGVRKTDGTWFWKHADGRPKS